MVTLWIGDFRIRQLQSVYKAVQETAEYHYLIEDQAEYTWFCNSAIPQLSSMALEEANLVIMLGFVDCIYSSVWSSFDAKKLAKHYADAINAFISKYTNFNVYICTVGPINSDYPFALSGNELITKNKLTEQIELFNTTLKSSCYAKVIDIYNYLNKTSFSTSDGVRYISDTCAALHNYIISSFKSSDSYYFSPRLQEPNSEVDSFLYWTPTALGGLNPFLTTQNSSVLPSCTAYAWGRFYEIIDEEPKLSTDSAEKWYSYTADGYKRGQEPRVGAVACWNNYVAIVEQVRDDGSITTSESNWELTSNLDIWRQYDRTIGDGNWGHTNGTFQGFIYCPKLEVDTSPKIMNFRVDKCLATEVAISFLASNYKTISYTVLSDDKEIKHGLFTEKTFYQTIHLTKLDPDTVYLIRVEAQNKSGEKVLRDISFITESVQPMNVSGIELSMNSASGEFSLKITKPETIGYLSSNSGYDIQLIVNNKIVKTITEADATKDVSFSKFNLKDKFKYEIKSTDNIQIGVRVWVKNASGTKIYDSAAAKTSKVICLLSKPVKVYLTK